MVTVSVLVPYRAGCQHRERAWELLRASYAAVHPDWEIITGTCADGPFNRSEAILDAAMQSSGDVLVVADADVWCEAKVAVTAVGEHGWAIPHCMIHRLSETSTAAVLTGTDWRGLELSQDNSQDSRPYRGHETATMVALQRDVLFDVPPDPRFIGWGQEDDAWAYALNTLIGHPWRGSEDLVHLWHPPQERMNRTIGSRESFALCRRYRNARRDPALMRGLLGEVAWGFSPSTASTTAESPNSSNPAGSRPRSTR